MLPSPSRWLFQVIVVLALVVLFVLHFTSRPPRLAYVDSSRLLVDYQGMVDARRTYNLHKQEWQRNLDTLQAEITRGLLTYQRTQAHLSPAQRQETETRLRLKRQQYLDYKGALQSKDGEEQQQLTQQVLDSTNSFLRKYGQQEGYDMILLTADGDNLAYTRRELDLTVLVLKGLNAKYKLESKRMPSK